MRLSKWKRKTNIPQYFVQNSSLIKLNVVAMQKKVLHNYNFSAKYCESIISLIFSSLYFHMLYNIIYCTCIYSLLLPLIICLAHFESHHVTVYYILSKIKS